MTAKTSKVRESKGGGCLMVLFFAIFAAAGSAAFYFPTWKPIAGLVAARGWVETECVITSSRVDESQGSDGSTYRVDIHYTYEVDSELRWRASGATQTHRGNRYDFSVGHSSGYKGKARVVEALPPGSETRCYYDPDQPGRSVINRSPGLYLLWGLFPLPFLAVGFGGLIFLLWPDRQRRTGSRPAPRKARGRAPRPARPRQAVPRRTENRPAGRRPAEVRPDRVRGPLELESRISRTVKVVGTFIAAAFWNGIVSVIFFSQHLPDYLRGDVDGWQIAFMIPFVLVGLFLLSFFGYHLLAWFNPRPRLTLADGHLTPGTETFLAWRFTGRAGRFEKLTIELEGRESARYRRGTKTYTDHHVFFSRELVSEAGRFAAIHRGNATLAIPERTMPTFDADNNDIEWRLKIRGDIPFWPDVIDDFPITVYPGERK